LVTRFINHLVTTRNYGAIANSHTLQFTTARSNTGILGSNTTQSMENIFRFAIWRRLGGHHSRSLSCGKETSCPARNRIPFPWPFSPYPATIPTELLQLSSSGKQNSLRTCYHVYDRHECGDMLIFSSQLTILNVH
jgi:hypothetical protein